MFCLCLFACMFEKKPHEKLSESTHLYSPNDLVKIDGKIWTFIRYLANGNCLLYYHENLDGKFITTFGLFHLNANGDFIQLPFANGVNKIETEHDHAPEICENYVQVQLFNGKRISLYMKRNSLVYDNGCSISIIK